MTIDEALAQAQLVNEEQEWIPLLEYPVEESYVSEDVFIDLHRRVIGDMSEDISTTEETNSEYISFVMDRYHDGVDLSTMLIQLQYELENGFGTVDGVVNAFMSAEQIKFGWIIPNTVTQRAEKIKIMIFCTGEISGNLYLLKTLPREYEIRSTLEIGGTIPEPDNDWYLQFANTMQQNVLEAKASAEAAAQSASDANDDLADILDIQSDVNSSKSTVQTLAQQVQDNTAKSQNSADAAKASEETARSWAEKAQELSGVSYASKELAGIVAPQDVYVNPENGHMSLITRTTDKTLYNSYSGGIKINKVYGKSEQKQYSGYNLLDFSNAKGGSNVGVTVAINDDGSYSYVGTPTDSNVNVWLLGNYASNTPILTLAPGKYYVKGVNLYYNSTNIFTGGRNGGFITLTEETPIAGVRAVSGVVGTSYNETWYPIIAKSDVEVPWEPYVGGIPSPNPDYPQEIKSVVNPVITLSDGENSQTVTLPFTLNAIPVSEGGNVTIDGQQYIADYVDVERGKIVQCVGFFNGNVFSYDEPRTRWFYSYANAKIKTNPSEIYSLCNRYLYATNSGNNTYRTGSDSYSRMFLIHDVVDADLSDVVIYTALEVPTEIDLTDEEVQVFLSLKSYDTITYLSTDSEIEPVIDLEYGTSRVGALTLDAWNTAQRNEIRISALETTQEITTEEEVTA